MKFKKLLAAVAATAILCLPSVGRAVTTNYTTYVDGQVLTASSLNSLQTNYTNADNAILDGDTFTGTMSFNSGADAVGYSDAGSTKKWELDSATGDVIISPRTIGTAINCEINYASGTITISGRGGAALSATNPCHVGIRSNSNGVVVTATFTANVTTTDGATSDTDSNLFGVTDANWANAMPMFFGVIYDGTTPYFGFSRKPLVVSGAAATDVCQEGDTDCDGENDFFIMTTGLTLSAWVNLPITQVAFLSATYATTGGAWTFAESAYTGFNKLYESLVWTFPQAQYGAAASTHMTANGGTAPVWTTDQYTYEINSRALVTLNMYFTGDGGTDGIGAVNATVAMPFTRPAGSVDQARNWCGYTDGATTITSGHMLGASLLEAGSTMNLVYLDAAAVYTVITNAMYSNGTRTIDCRMTFNALNN